jgi:hypothetical protein
MLAIMEHRLAFDPAWMAELASISEIMTLKEKGVIL